MNETLIHADVFFFLTSIAVIVATIVLGIAGIYIILILRDVKEIARLARHEAEVLKENVAAVREAVQAEASRARSLIGLFLSIFERKTKRSGERTRKRTNA